MIAPERERGRVKNWVHSDELTPVGGFGFIRRKTTGEDVFVHRTNLRGWPKVRFLEVGAVVEFDITPPPAGGRTVRGKPAYARARDVVVLEGPKPKRADAAKYLPGEKPGVVTREETFKMRGAGSGLA